MSQNPHAQFDETVLEMIERSPSGSVPSTPSYQDALKRLYASHQVYANADHKDGHVTARSLARMPVFHASNLDALIAGAISPEQLESNHSIFDRYVQSMPAERRARAEACRVQAAGKPPHHRKHAGAVAFDPVHSLVLVPGAGPHVGLPGNYLYGSLLQLGADPAATGWGVHLHDSDDGFALYDAADLKEAIEKLQEMLACVPFHLSEIEALGFRLK